MKLFITLTGFILLTLSSTMLAIVAAYPNREIPHLNIKIYDDLMPGGALPRDVNCSIESAQSSGDHLSCGVWRDDQMIGFTYNRRAQAIDYVSYIDLQDDMQQLLTVWGRPDGYVHDDVAWQFYWSDKQVYVVPKYGLSQYSKIGVVTFGTPEKDYKAWPDYGLLPRD